MYKPLNFFEETIGDTIDGDDSTYLQIGAPGPGILKEVAEVMKVCTSQHFENSTDRSVEILQYGCASGSADVKNMLAKFLTQTYRNPVRSEDLFINSGASQALTNILRYYFNEGDTLFVNDPTYFVLLRAATTFFRLNVVAVATDDSGMIVEDLKKHLRNLKTKPVSERYPYRAGVYVIPVYHNPTGVCLSPGRCRELVKLAREYDLLVVADDVYNILTYFPDDQGSTKPPARLIHYDNKSDADYKGNVISIGSFSKILSPGLRMGWYEMPQKIIEIFENIYVSDSGGGWSPYTSGLVGTGLKSGIVQNHVEKVRTEYGKRMKGVHDLLLAELGQCGVTCRCPRGGIFMWICLPEKCPSKDVLALCAGKVGFITGDRCSLSGQHINFMRISIAYYEIETLLAAVKQICDAVKTVLDRKA